MYKMSELRTSCPREAAKLLLILLLLTGFPRQLYSMDLRAGRRLTIPAGEVVSTNLYVAGGEVALAGSVEGDLTAAGGEIRLAAC